MTLAAPDANTSTAAKTSDAFMLYEPYHDYVTMGSMTSRKGSPPPPAMHPVRGAL